MEIVAHWDDHVLLRHVVLGLMLHPIINFSSALISVVGFEVSIDDEGLVVGKSIEIEARRCTVVMVHRVSEYLSTITESVVHWSLNPLHSLISKTLFLVLVVKARKEISIKTHLRHQVRIGIRVAKGINLPTDSGCNTKFLKSELVTHLHVVDHVLVVRARFIMHGPTSVQNFETT
jgi:hypothetical protein